MAVGDGATWAEHAYSSGNRRLQLTRVRHHVNLTVVLCIVSTRFLVHGPPVHDVSRTHRILTYSPWLKPGDSGINKRCCLWQSDVLFSTGRRPFAVNRHYRK